MSCTDKHPSYGHLLGLRFSALSASRERYLRAISVAALLLGVAFSAPCALAAYAQGEAGVFEFAQIGKRVPDGQSIALVFRARGEKTRFRVIRLRGGRWSGPRSSFGAGAPVSVFAVAGLKSVEDFEGFHKAPQDWVWAATMYRETSARDRQRIELRFTLKGEALQYRGRVLAADGLPPEALDVRFWMKTAAKREIQGWMHWAFDPVSGRFFACRTLAGPKAAYDWTLDLLPWRVGRLRAPRHEHSAPRYRYPWKRGVDTTVQLEAAGHLRFVLHGLERSTGLYRWTVLDKRAEMRPCADEVARDAQQHVVLAPGDYDLDVRMRGASRPIVKRSISIKGGEQKDLGLIDLSSRVKKLRVELQDRRGDSIAGMITLVRLQEKGRRYRGGNGMRCRSRDFAIPKDSAGLAIVVTAPQYGMRVFENLRDDLVVKLEKPKLVRLELRARERAGDLLEDLYLSVEPEHGYPGWLAEHRLFLPKGQESQRRMRVHALSEPVLRIPYAGTWLFEFRYVDPRGIRDTVSVPIPLFDAVAIDGVRRLKLRLPLKQLAKARARFLKSR